MEQENAKEESKLKKEIVKIDDSTLHKKIKTTIKPSQKEIDEIKTLWEKFHKELLERNDKKSG